MSPAFSRRHQAALLCFVLFHAGRCSGGRSDLERRVAGHPMAALLPIQNPDGGWPQSTSSEEPGRVYATSMSLLTLTVPYRILPIYQR